MSRSLRRFIARNRRNAALSWVARRATSVVRGYHNFDYDSRYNGERYLLSAVGAVTKRPLLFDVGANKGEWALIAVRECADAQVHAFELVPDTARELRKSLAGTPNVTVNAFGLADATETKPVRVMADNTRSTLVMGGVNEVEELTKIECQVYRGDEYIEQNQISRIDLLKIDTEGADHLVLKGFSNALADGLIRAIQFEYGRNNIAARFLLTDFYDLLTPHGFLIGKLYPNYVGFKPYSPNDEDFLGPNFVAVHRDWHELYQRLL